MKVNEKEKIFHKHIKKHKRRKKIVKKEGAVKKLP